MMVSLQGFFTFTEDRRRESFLTRVKVSIFAIGNLLIGLTKKINIFYFFRILRGKGSNYRFYG
jgi:predicted RNA-binding protein